MELRDITKELSLLKSCKTKYVDRQKEVLLSIYHASGRRFPIFTERVFAASAGSPVGLLNYKIRERLEDADPGRLFILERTDNRADPTRTRLFFVWVSPALVAKFTSGSADLLRVRASVIFHPFPHDYPAYWSGDIDLATDKNYLKLGVRYLFDEKHSVTQHFCAVRPSATGGSGDGLNGKTNALTAMVVVPVSSPSSFYNLSNPRELQEALEQIARRCYEGVTSRAVAPGTIGLERVAVSGYSFSGTVLRKLLDNAGANEPFMRKTLKEIYAFDIMLGERDQNKIVTNTRQKGYDEFWARLKAWQGDDSDKRIRLYSAEPGTVQNVYAELQERLGRYGGGHHNKLVPFAAFNGKQKADGSGTYERLQDAYEIYSTDNSRSLAVLPSGNALVYMSDENIRNKDGVQFGGDFEPWLEGHSWFVSRLQSHALFHSGM